MIKLKEILTESIPDYFRGYFDNIDDNMERLEKNVKQLIKDLGKFRQKMDNQLFKAAKQYFSNYDIIKGVF